MARRQQRRPAFRPARSQRRDSSDDSAAIEAGARRLLARFDEGAIRRMVDDLMLLQEEADRAAYEQPSPEALAAFRRARRELAEAKRALEIVERAA